MPDLSHSRFLVDHNVARLARWLRMIGYDSIVFDGPDDTDMARLALNEHRTVITRDSGFMKRRVVTSGRLPALLVDGDDSEGQIRQVMRHFGLDERGAFTLCIECNVPLEERAPHQVRDRVPRYVFQTQDQYVECPQCHRIYWKGTHWKAMVETMKRWDGEGKT